MANKKTRGLGFNVEKVLVKVNAMSVERFHFMLWRKWSFRGTNKALASGEAIIMRRKGAALTRRPS